ncbi:hypothetical protein L1887_53340 [Cichorium endivia]|nr:hypothetical protein L1887_53340 [Cichorium endivia]
MIPHCVFQDPFSSLSVHSVCARAGDQQCLGSIGRRGVTGGSDDTAPRQGGEGVHVNDASGGSAVLGREVPGSDVIADWQVPNRGACE